MKNLFKLLFAFLLILSSGKAFSASNGSNGGYNKPSPKNNDSIISNAGKSNDIVIFKMIPTPVTNNSGSLKRAGKVARTSNSRS